MCSFQVKKSKNKQTDWRNFSLNTATGFAHRNTKSCTSINFLFDFGLFYKNWTRDEYWNRETITLLNIEWIIYGNYVLPFPHFVNSFKSQNEARKFPLTKLYMCNLTVSFGLLIALRLVTKGKSQTWIAKF